MRIFSAATPYARPYANLNQVAPARVRFGNEEKPPAPPAKPSFETLYGAQLHSLGQDSDTAVYVAMLLSLVVASAEHKPLIDNFLKAFPDSGLKEAQVQESLNLANQVCGRDPKIKKPKFDALYDIAKEFFTKRDNYMTTVQLAAFLSLCLACSDENALGEGFSQKFPGGKFGKDDVVETLKTYKEVLGIGTPQ